jgi:hypothetical protein
MPCGTLYNEEYTERSVRTRSVTLARHDLQQDQSYYEFRIHTMIESRP